MTIAYDSLFEPTPEPERIVVDISPDPYAEGQRLAAVPPDVAAYVEKQQTDAAAIAEHALRPVRADWSGQLRAVTGGPAQVLADADATPRERKAAQAELATGVEKLVTARLKALDDIAAKADAELADLPHHRPDAGDLLKADELLKQLQVLVPRFAIPVVRRLLITNPMKDGKYGLVHTMLPLLKSLYEKEGAGYDTAEFHTLIRDVEIVARDRAWLAARKAQWAVAQARYKISDLGRRLVERDGDLTPVAASGWFADVGVAP